MEFIGILTWCFVRLNGYIDSLGNLIVRIVEDYWEAHANLSRVNNPVFHSLRANGSFTTRYARYSQSTIEGMGYQITQYIRKNIANGDICIITRNLGQWGLNAVENTLEIFTLDMSPEFIEYFKRNVLDHPAIVFKQAVLPEEEIICPSEEIYFSDHQVCS
jgi:hypothetical protein